MSAYDEVYLQPARANMGRMLDVAVGSMGFGLGEFYGLFLASGLAAASGPETTLSLRDARGRSWPSASR